MNKYLLCVLPGTDLDSAHDWNSVWWWRTTAPEYALPGLEELLSLSLLSFIRFLGMLKS